MSSHQFCRNISIECGEPLPGSGAAAKRYALLHWPRRHWRVPRTKSAEMSETLSEAIVKANEAGVHVALVDGDDIALSVDGKVLPIASQELAAEHLLNIASGGTLEGENDPRITILCCTDSKQDPCCAKYGFSTWKALRENAEPKKFRVLQSTHLGGCRFAATLIVLPARQRYGRLEPQAVPAFLEDLSKGVPYLPAYRGNPTLDAARQVAEHAALTYAVDDGATEVALQESPGFSNDPQNEAEFIAVVSSRRLRIRLASRPFEVSTRCDTIKTGSNSAIDSWKVVTVEPID